MPTSIAGHVLILAVNSSAKKPDTVHEQSSTTSKL